MTDLDLLSKHLKDAKRKFNDLKKSGIDEEILIVYLQHKTGLSKKKVKEFLKDMDEFYNKLITEEVAKAL